MQAFEEIPIGTRVEIIQPDYVAGSVGMVLGKEEVVEEQPTDRWLIQISSEDAILSLARDEFRVVDYA